MKDSNKWNVGKSLLIGAGSGAGGALLYGNIGSVPQEVLGTMVGAAIGGGFLGGIIAVVRNALV